MIPTDAEQSRGVRLEDQQMSPEDFLDITACCALAGGSRPIHKASWYRHVRDGVMARPVKVGALSRWLRSEVEASLQCMVDGRVS
jgi:predicted DNA-binding transcriptional regulator AlpA